MGNFTPMSRRSAKCASRIAWVHSGALRAPLCIQGDVMAHFVGRREIGVKFPMRAASVDPKTHTTHTPDYKIQGAPSDRFCCASVRQNTSWAFFIWRSAGFRFDLKRTLHGYVM